MKNKMAASIPAMFTKEPNLLDDLKTRYAEPARAYHNWTHIEQLLTIFAEIKEELHDHESVLYAIYYHDAIYNTASTTNEEDSAKLFETEIGALLPRTMTTNIIEFILATKTHLISPALDEGAQSDCAYFLDIDMSILGGGHDQYRKYAKNIRKEYSAFNDEMYNFGRAKILKEFLSRKKIFETNIFNQKLEEAARRNIDFELNLLKA